MEKERVKKAGNRILTWFRKYSLLKTYFLAIIIGFVVGIGEIITYSGNDYEGILGVLFWIIMLPFAILEELQEVLVWGILQGVFLVHPILLTVSNIIFTIIPMKETGLQRIFKHLELTTFVEGTIFSALLLGVSDIRPDDWTVAIYTTQLHTPVWTQGQLTIGVLALLGAAGYLILRCVTLNKLPPLAAVFSIAGMYLGMFVFGSQTTDVRRFPGCPIISKNYLW